MLFECPVGESLCCESFMVENVSSGLKITGKQSPKVGNKGQSCTRCQERNKDASDVSLWGVLLLSCSVVSLCDPMDCRTSGSSALQHLPEFAQSHVHWVGDAIYLILWYPLLLLPSIFASIRVFSKRWLFTSGGQSIGASASALILPVNIQGWFPLGLTGSISLLSKGLSSLL